MADTIGVILSPNYKEKNETYPNRKDGEALFLNFVPDFLYQQEMITNNIINFNIKKTWNYPNNQELIDHYTHYNDLRSKGVQFFIGGGWSNQAALTLDQIQFDPSKPHDVLLLSPTSDFIKCSYEFNNTPATTTLKTAHDRLYRLYPCIDYLMNVIAKLIANLEKISFVYTKKQVIIVHQTDSDNIALASNLENQLIQLGNINVLGTFPFEEKEVNLENVESIKNTLNNMLNTISNNNFQKHYVIVFLAKWSQILNFLLIMETHSEYKKLLDSVCILNEPTREEIIDYSDDIIRWKKRVNKKTRFIYPIKVSREKMKLEQLSSNQWINDNFLPLTFGDLCWIDAAWMLAKSIVNVREKYTDFTVENVIKELKIVSNDTWNMGKFEFDAYGDRKYCDYDLYWLSWERKPELCPFYGEYSFTKIGEIDTELNIDWKINWLKVLITNIFEWLSPSS